MAYNEISDARVQNGAIANSALFFDLRDNPKGIAAGDPGAPRVVIGALAGPGAGSISLGAATSNGQISRAYGSGVAYVGSGSGYQKMPFTAPSGHSGFYVQKDGDYRVSIGLSRVSGSTAVFCRMYRNGVAYGAVMSTASSTSSSVDVELLSGDVVELYIDRNGSEAHGNIEILGAAYDSAAVRFSV